MTTTLQIVDDAGTTLFDLNGTNAADAGSVTCELLHNPNWSAPTHQFSRFEPSGSDGGMTSYHRAGLTQATIPIRISATNYDNLSTAVGRLSLLLAQGCTMKWIPNGASLTKFVDIEPTDTPVYFDGRELAMYAATSLFDTPAGVTLNLTRQPFFRGNELSPAVNICLNSTLLTDLTAADKAPDSWTIDSGTSVTDNGVSASHEAFSLTYATNSTRNLKQTTATGTVAASTSYTFSFYARATSGAGTCSAAFQPTTSDGTTAVGSEVVGSTAALTTSWQRFTATGTTTASGTNSRAILSIRIVNASGATVEYRFAQFEQASSASTFRCGVESLSNDPTVTPGRVTYFYNAGDAPAPVRCKFAGGSVKNVILGVKSSGGITGANSVTSWANGYFKQAESMTQYTDTATTSTGTPANQSGTGNDLSATTFATTNTITEARLRWQLSAAELAGVVGGRFQVWIRGGVTGVGMEADIAVSTNFSSGVLNEVALPPVAFDPEDTSLYDIYLGTFAVPSDASTVMLTFFVQRTAGSNYFKWDFATLVPADVCAGVYGQKAGEGSTTLAYTNLETDPEIPRVASVTTADLVDKVLHATGPVPFFAPPGLSAVYVVPTTTDAAEVQFQNNTFSAKAVRFTYSPRYYA